MNQYCFSSAGRGNGRGAMPFLMSFALEHEIVTLAWIDNASVQFPLNIYATKAFTDRRPEGLRTFGRIERGFDGGNHAALDGERFSRNARACRGLMPAAAELAGHVADIHAVAFGAETHAGQFRFHLFKDARYNDRLNGADVINEALGVRGVCAGAGEIGLLQPKVGHLVVVGEVEMSVNMLEQPDARERIG